MKTITERDVIAIIRSIPGLATNRFTPGPFSPKGVPDIYVTDEDGNGLWIEIKIGRTPLTALQTGFLERARRAAMLLRVQERRGRWVVEMTQSFYNGEDNQIQDWVEAIGRRIVWAIDGRLNKASQ